MEKKLNIIVFIVISLVIFSGCSSVVKDKYRNNETLLINELNRSCEHRDLAFKITRNDDKLLSFNCKNEFIYETYTYNKKMGQLVLIDEIKIKEIPNK